MRFAAIADVHGNYLALEAVIADIRAHDIDAIVDLGDMASGPLDAAPRPGHAQASEAENKTAGGAPAVRTQSTMQPITPQR